MQANEWRVVRPSRELKRASTPGLIIGKIKKRDVKKIVVDRDLNIELEAKENIAVAIVIRKECIIIKAMEKQ